MIEDFANGNGGLSGGWGDVAQAAFVDDDVGTAGNAAQVVNLDVAGVAIDKDDDVASRYGAVMQLPDQVMAEHKIPAGDAGVEYFDLPVFFVLAYVANRQGVGGLLAFFKAGGVWAFWVCIGVRYVAGLILASAAGH